MSGSSPYPPQSSAPTSYPMGAYLPHSDVYDTESQQQYPGNNMMVGTEDAAVRLGFIRKVYSLLTVCFAVTVGISCVFSFVTPVREFVITNPSFLYVGWIVGLVSYVALVCLRLKRPWDAVLLSVFVLGFSFMIGTICAAYFEIGWGRVVLNAFITTTAIFVTLTAYVLITKKDFSFLGPFLLGATLALILGYLLVFVVGFVSGTRSKWVYFGISVAGAIIFTGYILYDTSLILHRLGPDDWVMGVASLYIDVTQLFLYMLSIFSALQS